MQPSEKKRFFVKHCVIPQRYLVAIMVNLGIITAFLLRNSQKVVLKTITKPELRKHKSIDNRCNFTSIDTKKIILKMEELYDWNQKTRTQIAQIFYYGYLLGHLPGGYIADKHGGKYVFAISIFGPGVLFLLTPFIITQTRSSAALMVLLFVAGTLQGGMFPAANNLISMWTPRRERGGIAGIVFAASQMGIFINNICTTYIMQTAWPNVFYIYGGLAVAWTCLWMFMGHSNYTTNPFINDNELRYLKNELESRVFYKKKSIPWKQILRSLPVWSLMVVQLGHLWIWHSLGSQMPVFIRQILRFNVMSSHLVASLPYGLSASLTIVQGFISDIIINRRYTDTNDMRKICTTLGVMGPGIFIMFAGFCGCNRMVSVYMFCIALSLKSFYYSGTRIISLDIAPNYSGLILGIVNGLGAIPGIIHKYYYDNTENWPLSEWRKLFYTYLVLSASSNIFFVLFGTSSQQPWNNWEKNPQKIASKVNVKQTK